LGQHLKRQRKVTEQDPLQFGGFKSLTLEDQEVFSKHLKADPPRTSELTFTNLFMWRAYYRTAWRESEDCLLIIQQPRDAAPFALPPMGRGDKSAAVEAIFEAMASAGTASRISRAPQDLAALLDPRRYDIRPNRDQSDYVYESQRLISLAGRKMHRKKNHLNQFKKHNIHEYQELGPELINMVLGMQEDWCQLRDCPSDIGLMNEDMAVQEAIANCEVLGFKGGAILVDGKVEAFSFGELLNPDTAVIHIEKANPDIPGLYAAINQMFASAAWSGVEFINREQDLGLPGLRKAKESYHPHHLVDKYEISALAG
jgi:hypothetical protein